MSRLMRAFGIGVLVVGGAGYGATAYITSTTHVTTPPGPYASEPPPADCARPGRHPVDCPPRGDGCPPSSGRDARAEGREHPTWPPVPAPGPTDLPSAHSGDFRAEARMCAVYVPDDRKGD